MPQSTTQKLKTDEKQSYAHLSVWKQLHSHLKALGLQSIIKTVTALYLFHTTI